MYNVVTILRYNFTLTYHFLRKVWTKLLHIPEWSCCGISYHMDNILGTISCCVIMLDRSSQMNSIDVHTTCDNSVCVCNDWSLAFAHELLCFSMKINPTNAHKLQRMQSIPFQSAITAHKYVSCKVNTACNKTISKFQ
jgi:hypothetical protein